MYRRKTTYTMHTKKNTEYTSSSDAKEKRMVAVEVWWSMSTR